MEEWRPIEGFPYYQVSNLGRIKSFAKSHGGFSTREKILKQEFIGGYCRVTLSKDKYKQRELVHRLVAKAFIPNPENLPQVNHKDSDGENNVKENLEWSTPHLNNLHAIFKESYSPWKNPNIPRKLTPEQVLQIRDLRKEGKTYVEIGLIFGISNTMVYYICKEKQWK